MGCLCVHTDMELYSQSFKNKTNLESQSQENERGARPSQEPRATRPREVGTVMVPRSLLGMSCCITSYNSAVLVDWSSDMSLHFSQHSRGLGNDAGTGSSRFLEQGHSPPPREISASHLLPESRLFA